MFRKRPSQVSDSLLVFPVVTRVDRLVTKEEEW